MSPRCRGSDASARSGAVRPPARPTRGTSSRCRQGSQRQCARRRALRRMPSGHPCTRGSVAPVTTRSGLDALDIEAEECPTDVRKPRQVRRELAKDVEAHRHGAQHVTTKAVLLQLLVLHRVRDPVLDRGHDGIAEKVRAGVGPMPEFVENGTIGLALVNPDGRPDRLAVPGLEGARDKPADSRSRTGHSADSRSAPGRTPWAGVPGGRRLAL